MSPLLHRSVHTASSILHCLLNHIHLSEKLCLRMRSAYKSTTDEGFSFYPAALITAHFPIPSVKWTGRSQIASMCWLHPEAETRRMWDFCGHLLLVCFFPMQNSAQGRSSNRRSHIMSFHLQTGNLPNRFLSV